jgi:hypothetical protein
MWLAKPITNLIGKHEGKRTHERPKHRPTTDINTQSVAGWKIISSLPNFKYK